MPRKDRHEITHRILEHVGQKEYRPKGVGKLARDIGVDHSEFNEFRIAVKELMRAGRVVLGSGDMVTLPTSAQTITGRFRGHARGFGFVIPESPAEHGDLFIPPNATLNAINGDIVVARITRRKEGSEGLRVEGEIVEVIERSQNRFVGELIQDGGNWQVRPDGNTLHVPILLGDVSSSRAQPGDQVVVEITEYPSPMRPARGVIVEVLGRRGDPGIDTISVIRQYQFREEFPEEVIEDARRVIREYSLDEELENREDLRGVLTVTIDPDDAKDFDDAISLRRVGKGFELGVHIADVSRFVQIGQPLDTEASIRGNSIYFPRHVLPMLPEVLSNGLCSLQEGQPRLTKSAFIEYDAKGNRKAKRYANTIIHSDRRFTYREAQAVLEGKTEGYAPEIIDLLKDMEHLAQTIRKRRLAAGMLVLDLPGVELVLNDENAVTGVNPEDTSFTHTLIEMFMVEANDAVAELMTDLHVPHLRRIHPEPPPDAQAKLATLLRALGKAPPKALEKRDLIKLLDSVRGQPDAFAVNLAVLRSMSQAEYSPKMIGHYALASENYSHFTSPIRRYPDLVLHRLLDLYLTGRLKRPKDRKLAPSEETLLQVGKRSSYTERRAEAAERELRLVKMLRFLEGRLGEIEDGVVTGVTNIGVFVQLRKYLVDGLIRFDDLADDWWNVNTQGGYVVGERSGRRIGIGDVVKVQIAAVNMASRELNLVLAPGDAQAQTPRTGGRAPGRQPGGPPTRPGQKKRGHAPKAWRGGSSPSSPGKPSAPSSPGARGRRGGGGGRRGKRGRGR